jgi:UPF0755 protein
MASPLALKPKSPRFLWFFILPISAVVVAIATAFWIFWWPNHFDGEERIIYVSRGTSFASVVDSLERHGLIRSRRTFELAGRLLGLTGSVQYGRYRFRSGMSNITLLRDLAAGLSNFPIPVRLGEGARIQRIAGRAARELGIDSTRIVTLCHDSAFIKSLGLDVPSLEGYLLPDTYHFFWETDESAVVTRLVRAFKEFYVDSLRARQEQTGMTLHQVVTLASIVEGETSLDSERATIAGVYLNRLRLRMPLQADPTIQYVLPDGPRRLLYSDLRITSPYNTYRHSGLPPGPINNPGRKSILAVLYPERHDLLYFVADGTGGHRFSKSYSEHLRAVREWRRIRQRIEQSAGPDSAAHRTGR